jgi:putative hydrolase of the HAD superfamily
MQYDAVVFDLFGTLAASFSVQEYERALSEMACALSAPRDDFARLWLASFNERCTGKFESPAANIEHICLALHLPVSPKAVEAAARIRFDFSRRSMAPLPGAVEALERLKASGYKTGLLTDCSWETPALWPETPLAPLVDVAVFSCLERIKKPDPRIYLLLCERLAVQPQACLYVGDGGSHELTGATGVGMSALLIRAPSEISHDTYRIDVDQWDGPVVATFDEVLVRAGLDVMTPSASKGEPYAPSDV